MIRFFKQIRQRPLPESPPEQVPPGERLGRYVLYAIGEILLVVIGILIALWVNNWNEERENLRREQSFYQSILVDLESDQQQLNTLSEFYQNRIGNLAWLLALVRDPERPVDPMEFGKHTEPLYYSESAVSFDATFEASKNTGAFDRFSNKILLKQLVEYYANFEDIEDIHTASLRFIESAFEPIMAPLTNSFLTRESAGEVLIAGGNTEFYALLESVEDRRPGNAEKEIGAFLQRTEFESYLIGDLGRSFNMLQHVETRTLQLQALQLRINQYLND